jgi:hypothetical protein
MDGESFDRLSVAVHRLRDQATRRGALRLLLGGSVAAVTGLAVDETEARKRRHKKRRKGCKGFGGRCNGSRDCCDGRCRNGFCFPGNGGGGGGNGCCRGFPNDYRCCRFNGVDICVPRNDVRCNDGDFCPNGWETCGFNGPVRDCCSPDTHCCRDDFGGHFCLNDMFDCDDFFDTNSQSADSATASNRDEAVSDPIPVTEIDPEEFS